MSSTLHDVINSTMLSVKDALLRLVDYPQRTIVQQIEVVNSITSTNSHLCRHIEEKVMLLHDGYFAALFQFFSQATLQRVWLRQPGSYETIHSDLLSEYHMVIAAQDLDVLPIAQKKT